MTSFPPSIIRLRFQKDDQQFSLWLPLILIWPLIVIVSIVLFPIVLILATLLWPAGWGRPLLRSGPVLLRIFCALRNLEINVEEPTERVFISFR